MLRRREATGGEYAEKDWYGGGKLTVLRHDSKVGANCRDILAWRQDVTSMIELRRGGAPASNQKAEG